MRSDDSLQPILVVFPEEEGGKRILLDPQHFAGLDEIGSFLAILAEHYGRAFLQSGRAIDLPDALQQIGDMFLMDVETAIEKAIAEEDGALD